MADIRIPQLNPATGLVNTDLREIAQVDGTSPTGYKTTSETRAQDIAFAFANAPAQSANTVFAGPASGSAATPTFRLIDKLMNSGGTQTSVDNFNYRLNDSSGAVSMSYSARTASGTNGNVAINWNGKFVNYTSGTLSYNWNLGSFYDPSALLALTHVQRQAIANDGTTPNIDWSTPNATIVNGVATTGTPSIGQVPTATGSTTATWQTTAAPNYKGPVAYATAAALAACTYNNGSSGVGATLTANSNGFLTVDGSGPNNGDLILVTQQSDARQNGLYVVTSNGGASSQWVLTRSTSYDTTAQINNGDLFNITGGTKNAGAIFWQNGSSIVIGTSSIVFNGIDAQLISGVNVSTTSPTIGQVLTATSGTQASWNTLTPSSILPVVDVTGTTQTLATNTRYVCDNVSAITFSMPSGSANQGDVIEIYTKSGGAAGGWLIQQTVAGQQINAGASSTTSGTGGSVASTYHTQYLKLFCTTPGTASVWTAQFQDVVTIV